MKVLLWYMLSSFCAIIVAGGRSKVQITMNGPIDRCPDFEADKSIFDLAGLQFIQTSDADFVLSGKYTIKETIDGPIAINSVTFERGTWVTSMLNQNIPDVCKELEKPKRPDWVKIFEDWTVDKKCPFIAKEGEFKNLVFFDSQNLKSLALLSTLNGKYKTESRFQKMNDGEIVDIDCFMVNFEMASA